MDVADQRKHKAQNVYPALVAGSLVLQLVFYFMMRFGDVKVFEQSETSLNEHSKGVVRAPVQPVVQWRFRQGIQLEEIERERLLKIPDDK